MKRLRFSLLLSLIFGAAYPLVQAAPSPAPTAPAAAASPTLSATIPDDLSPYKDADSLWKHLQELRKEPTTKPKSREEYTAVVLKWFGDQRAAADAFQKTYPQDPRRFAAKMVTLQANFQLSQLPGADESSKVSADEVLKELDAIKAAPDAPEDIKGEAGFVQAMMGTAKLNPRDPATLKEFLKASDSFLEHYGEHKLAPDMRLTQVRVAAKFETPEGEAVLQKYAAGKDEKLASAAQQILSKGQKLKSLKTTPLALKFTATDGQAVDLEKMRGKVVLVDFWASWCGPCMQEAPNVVATYQKWHDKGFEILGISLDQDKASMDAALAKHGMKWPQYFDGKGWENTLSTSFGITSIPAAWLVDKKGMVRETSVRGEALGTTVEKLLAE